MTIRTTGFVVAVLFTVGPVGCGGGDSSDDNANQPTTSTATPDELCQTKCQMMLAPACPNMPPDYAANCPALCKAKYTNYANCEAQLKVIDTCATTKMTYGCNASGTIQLTPSGGCATESLGCLNCTQSLEDCF
jgi:hypothetical protein